VTARAAALRSPLIKKSGGTRDFTAERANSRARSRRGRGAVEATPINPPISVF